MASKKINKLTIQNLITDAFTYGLGSGAPVVVLSGEVDIDLHIKPNATKHATIVITEYIGSIDYSSAAICAK